MATSLGTNAIVVMRVQSLQCKCHFQTETGFMSVYDFLLLWMKESQVIARKIVFNIYQGPVVQSIVSLTSSLRLISLTVLADSMYNILIYFAEKMWVAFALQKLLTFFQQKISAYLCSTRCKF